MRFLKSTKPDSVVKLKEPTRRQSWPSKLANRRTMPLKMRPTCLGHGVYKDDVDYGVFCGEWCIGRIYQTRTGPESLRWGSYAARRAAADAIAATVRSPAAPPSLLSTAIAALCVQAIWMTRAHSISSHRRHRSGRKSAKQMPSEHFADYSFVF